MHPSRACWYALLLGLLALPQAPGAVVSAELLDLAARIDYGFYAEEPAVVEAARSRLAIMAAGAGRGAADAAPIAYYRAVAAYRLAQLGATSARGRATIFIEECVDQGQLLVEHTQWAAEAWILVAACSGLGAAAEPVRAPLHQRRRDRALERAEQLEGGNPRALLVQAWGGGRAARNRAGSMDAVAERLEAALRAFRDGRRSRATPTAWGEAETLAQLGEIRLEQGRLREARDLVEQALIIAPHYHLALRLGNRLSSTE